MAMPQCKAATERECESVRLMIMLKSLPEMEYKIIRENIVAAHQYAVRPARSNANLTLIWSSDD